MSPCIALCVFCALWQELPEEPTAATLYGQSEVVLCGETIRLSDEFRMPSNNLSFQFVVFKLIKVYKDMGGKLGSGQITFAGDECDAEAAPAVLVLIQKESSWTERLFPSYCLRKRYALFLRQDPSMDCLYVRSEIDGRWMERPWTAELACQIEQLAERKNPAAASQPATRPATPSSRPAGGRE